MEWAADDLDRVPGLPPHTELIDGRLFFREPQSAFHSVGNCVLEAGLRRTCPAGLRVRREMSVVIGARQRPEPDLIVVRAEADASMDPDLVPGGRGGARGRDGRARFGRA